MALSNQTVLPFFGLFFVSKGNLDFEILFRKYFLFQNNRISVYVDGAFELMARARKNKTPFSWGNWIGW